MQQQQQQQPQQPQQGGYEQNPYYPGPPAGFPAGAPFPPPPAGYFRPGPFGPVGFPQAAPLPPQFGQLPQQASPKRSPGKVVAMRRVWPPSQNPEDEQKLINNIWNQLPADAVAGPQLANAFQQQAAQDPYAQAAPPLPYPVPPTYLYGGARRPPGPLQAQQAALEAQFAQANQAGQPHFQQIPGFQQAVQYQQAAAAQYQQSVPAQQQEAVAQDGQGQQEQQQQQQQQGAPQQQFAPQQYAQPPIPAFAPPFGGLSYSPSRAFLGGVPPVAVRPGSPFGAGFLRRGPLPPPVGYPPVGYPPVAAPRPVYGAPFGAPFPYGAAPARYPAGFPGFPGFPGGIPQGGFQQPPQQQQQQDQGQQQQQQ